MSYYTPYADPSDSWSNHWSNAPQNDETCPECGSEETFETPKLDTEFCCKKCFKKF